MGQACYPADILIPGTLWGKALRSPFPHARILRIDASKARRVPGVHEVLTAADIPDIRVGRRLKDMPVIAQGKVRFIGEKVAAVAAEDPDIAEEALDLIDIDYEELPAIFDPVKALEPDAPIVHEGINAYGGLPEPVQEPTNRFSQVVLSKGDLEKGFAEADEIFDLWPRDRQPHHGTSVHGELCLGQMGRCRARVLRFEADARGAGAGE